MLLAQREAEITAVGGKHWQNDEVPGGAGFGGDLVRGFLLQERNEKPG